VKVQRSRHSVMDLQGARDEAIIRVVIDLKSR